MDDAVKNQIVELLTAMVIDLAPDANLRPMYGGTVIELVRDDPKSRIGGLYTYAEYVSFEFAKGVSFDDPESVLEGAGKLRRHIKLRGLAAIESKGCAGFLRQAISTF